MPIKCPHCGREFPGDKLNARHLSICNPSSKPKVPPCLCGHESTSLTQMKRHRRICEVWENRDVEVVRRSRMKATSLDRYGVDDASQAPEAQAKRAATNQERYGASNPFCRESSIFDAVQAAIPREGLQGDANPFSRPDVKEKIREHWQREHGVNSPQQVPEIRARTRATNLERYGHEEVLAVPEVRETIRSTCEARYGGPAPSCDPVVQATQQATNMGRYGVPWTAMDPEVRAKQLASMVERYGSHFFASDEGKDIIRGVMMEKYGVQFPGEMEGHWEKAVAAFQKRFGVDHPLQVPELLVKREATNFARYGWKNFIGSEEFVRACLRSYGVPIPKVLPNHPMKVLEFARLHLERMTRAGPNGLERAVHALAPALMFTGDGSFWRHLPKLGHFKNPDFILPGPDPEHPMRGVTKVVEVFGDYWHGRMKTGVANFEHEQELVDAFAEIGIECLVLWESGVEKDLEAVQERLVRFRCP